MSSVENQSFPIFLSVCNYALQLVLAAVRAVRCVPLECNCVDLLRSELSTRKLRLFYGSLTAEEQILFLQEIYDNVGLTIRDLSIVPPATTLRRSKFQISVTNQCKTSNFQIFSESEGWRKQHDFYRSKKETAFETDVPFLISSNRFVAKSYLDIIDEMVQKFVANSRKKLESVNVCVFEIGSGHGIISYLLATYLRQKLYKSKVICSDFHQGVMESLMALPWYQILLSQGVLDYAIIKASTEDSESDIKLLYSGQWLSEVQKNNGMFDLVILVANYALDSFPVDLIAMTPDVEGQKIQVFEVGMSSVCGHHAGPDDKVQPLSSSQFSVNKLMSDGIKPTSEQVHRSEERSVTRKRNRRSFSMSKSRCSFAFQKLCDININSGEDMIYPSLCTCDTLQCSTCWRKLVVEDILRTRGLIRDTTGVNVAGSNTGDRPEFSCERLEGIYVVPTGAKELLCRLRRAIIGQPQFAMLVGDCFLEPQDSRWLTSSVLTQY